MASLNPRHLTPQKALRNTAIMGLCVLMSNSLQPHGLWPTRLLCPWDSPSKNTEVVPCPPSGDLPNPGIKPRSPALQADSLSSDPPGKPVVMGHQHPNNQQKPGFWCSQYIFFFLALFSFQCLTNFPLEMFLMLEKQMPTNISRLTGIFFEI